MSRLLLRSGGFYLHIPRTGGTYVENVLLKLGIRAKWKRQARTRLPVDHTLLSHYPPQRLSGVDTVFTFIRHPIQFYESVHKWISENEPLSHAITRFRWHPIQPAVKVWDADFNLWIDRMLVQYPAWVTRLYELYVGPDGGEFCHFIGRTENLTKDLIDVLHELGYKQDASWYLAIFGTAHLNATSNQPFIGIRN